MNTSMIISTLNKKRNGSWFNASWVSDLPLNAAAKKAGVIGYKITNAQCRKGIQYKSQKNVKAKIDHGYELKSELPWGNWKSGHEGLIIEHKNNNYVRLYLGPNKSKVEYYLNGSKVTYEDLKNSGYLQASFFNKSDEKPDAITVKCENIQEIK